MIQLLELAAFWVGGALLCMAPFVLTTGKVRALRDAERRAAAASGEVIQFPNPVSEKSARPRSLAPSWASTMVRPKIGRARKIG